MVAIHLNLEQQFEAYREKASNYNARWVNKIREAEVEHAGGRCLKMLELM